MADGVTCSACGTANEAGRTFCGERLLSDDRLDEAEPLLVEVSEIFERLQATPWLERLAAVEGASAQPAASG
jgi:hypothetical protein